MLSSPAFSPSAHDLRPSTLAQMGPSRRWTGGTLGLAWLGFLVLQPQHIPRTPEVGFPQLEQQPREVCPLSQSVLCGYGLALAGGGQRDGSNRWSRAQSLTGDSGGIFQPWHSCCMAAVAVSMSEFNAVCGIKARVRHDFWGQPCSITKRDFGGEHGGRLPNSCASLGPKALTLCLSHPEGPTCAWLC